LNYPLPSKLKNHGVSQMFDSTTLTFLMLIASLFHAHSAQASLFDQIGITKDVCGHNGLCGNASATIGDVVSEMKKAKADTRADSSTDINRKLIAVADVPEGAKIPMQAFKQLPNHFRIERVKDRFGRSGTLCEVWTSEGSTFEKYVWRSKTQVIIIEVKNGLIHDRFYHDADPSEEEKAEPI
jgi:hypothetical protein